MTKIRSLTLAFFLAAGVTVFTLQYHAYSEDESPIKVGPKGEIEVGGTKMDEQGNIQVEGIGVTFAPNGDIYESDGTKVYDAATGQWAEGFLSADEEARIGASPPRLCHEVERSAEVVLKECWWKEKGIWNARAVVKNESSNSLDVRVKCHTGELRTELHDVLSPGEEDDFDWTLKFPSYEGKNRPNRSCNIENVQVHTPKPESESVPEA